MCIRDRRIGAVAAVVRRYGATPAAFRWLRMTATAVGVLEQHNAAWQQGRSPIGPFTWGHLAGGFCGFHCPE
eukprot:6489893-Alexandrium_andersonii.AAC.1